MKKRLKKKMETPSVKFKHKTPVKHRHHRWTMVSFTPIKEYDYVFWYNIELQCQICGKKRTVIGMNYQVNKLNSFLDNFWAFSNIRQNIG